MFDLTSTKEAGTFAVGSDSNVVDASVNADNSIIRFFNGGNFSFKGNGKIDLFLSDIHPCVTSTQ
jgi:hypothetical protein